MSEERFPAQRGLSERDAQPVSIGSNAPRRPRPRNRAGHSQRTDHGLESASHPATCGRRPILKLPASASMLHRPGRRLLHVINAMNRKVRFRSEGTHG